jgi:hypothetical protein
VVSGAGHKAKRFILQCINGVSSPRYRTLTMIVHNAGMTKTEIIKEIVEVGSNTQKATTLSVKCFRDYFK